jgi:hypothetical protein
MLHSVLRSALHALNTKQRHTVPGCFSVYMRVCQTGAAVYPPALAAHIKALQTAASLALSPSLQLS